MLPKERSLETLFLYLSFETNKWNLQLTKLQES